jgi:cholesterol 7-dehydrogenase
MAVGGTVRGDCLECPFHLWRFKGEDGKCSSIPYSGKGRIIDLMTYIHIFVELQD